MEYADVETSSDAYARRFASPVGAYFLEVQARLTLELLRPFPGARVLDVGGGHGQLTGPLVEAGHSVTILGSDAACAHRVRSFVDAGRARFETGDLLRAPFDDRAFEVVLAYRLLPHVPEWQRLVAELCRLASRAVIVDYPTTRSVNAFADAFFGAKQRVEGDTRPFTVFEDRKLAAALEAGSFRVSARRPEFFFPMALHRLLGSRALASGIEKGAGAAGLVTAFGSPVILRAERV